LQRIEKGACSGGVLVWAGLVLFASLCNAQTPGSAIGDDCFQDVIVEGRFFDPAKEPPLLRVRLRESALLDVVAYDQEGRLVAWKGGTTSVARAEIALGDLPSASEGIYLFCLIASDGQGKRLGVYPRNLAPGEALRIAESDLDPRKQEIRYLLPKVARVRSRIGFRDGAYLQPIQAWQAQPAGWHAIPWDGTCQQGLFSDLYRNPQVKVIVTAVSLPVNTLISRATAAPANGADQIAVSLPTRIRDLSKPPWPISQLMKASKDGIWMADDYRLTLEVRVDPLSQVATFAMDCAQVDRERLLNKRYEIMLFLDQVYLCEEEGGMLPFNYKMSTRGITPGKHVITANVVDTDGNLGAVSREFEVQKGQ
jgi:hypothetical protein